MAELWPWLAVAGTGALHGLNPATGWLLAAAQGVRSRQPARALRALLPIGVGYLASTGLIAGAIAFGLAIDRSVLCAAAAGLLVVATLAHLRRHASPRWRAPAGQAALGLWSFAMTTVHGAGLMLIPALMPLCLGAASAARPAASSKPLLLAFAAVAVHAVAMLAATGAVAIGVSGGVKAILPSRAVF